MVYSYRFYFFNRLNSPSLLIFHPSADLINLFPDSL